MIKKNFKIVLYSITFIAIGTGVFVTLHSCSKDASTSNELPALGKEEVEGMPTFLKPLGGFMCISTNTSKKFREVYVGMTPEDFINTKTYIDTNLVSDIDVLYSFSDDLDTIWVSNQSSEGFDLKLFGDSYHFYDFQNTKKGMQYKILTPNGNVIKQYLQHDNTDANELLKAMAEIDMFGNPFIEYNIEAKGKFLPILKKILKKSSWVAVAVSVIAIVVDQVDNSCKESLEIDRYNCEHGNNKCIEKISRCHFKCIPCDNGNNE